MNSLLSMDLMNYWHSHLWHSWNQINRYGIRLLHIVFIRSMLKYLIFPMKKYLFIRILVYPLKHFIIQQAESSYRIQMRRQVEIGRARLGKECNTGAATERY